MMKIFPFLQKINIPYILISITIFPHFQKVTEGQVLDSDSDEYSEALYHQLASEYYLELTKTTAIAQQGSENFQPGLQESPDHSEEADPNDNYDPSDPKVTEESYNVAIARLQCNNPWFWNSFKCLWLDLRERRYVPRTRSNAITVSWFLGPPVLILFAFLCTFCVVAFYLQARIKHIAKKIDEIRKTYEPGKITLPDGRVKKYEPTEEEVDAFEDLFSTLVSIV